MWESAMTCRVGPEQLQECGRQQVDVWEENLGTSSVLDRVSLRCLSDIQVEMSCRWLITSPEMSVKCLSAPNPPFGACSVIMELNPVNIFTLPSGMILCFLSRVPWQGTARIKGFFSWLWWTLLGSHLHCAWHLQSLTLAVGDSQSQLLAGAGSTRHPIMDGFLQYPFVQLCHRFQGAAPSIRQPAQHPKGPFLSESHQSSSWANFSTIPWTAAVPSPTRSGSQP